jgi:hypothetical protein
MPVRNEPCLSCPYRLDCPSGVWHESEYLKLAEYDLPTSEQPMGPFLCHDGDRESVLCRGWFDVHRNQEGEHDVMGLRIGFMQGRVTEADMELPPCKTPLHASGLAACEAGMEDIEQPSRRAVELMGKLSKKLQRKRKAK